jgi:hypothetical protein
MSKNHHEPYAQELWLYFQGVMNWVKAVFPKYRREMKGIEWESFTMSSKPKNLIT